MRRRAATDPGAALGVLAASGRAPAFVRAASASVGTGLAVFQWVPCAFVGAHVAHLDADLADHPGKFAVACHGGRRKAAYLSAVHVERDTARQRGGIAFPQAGRSAMVAGGRADVAGLDTGFAMQGLRRHEVSPVSGGRGRLSCLNCLSCLSRLSEIVTWFIGKSDLFSVCSAAAVAI
jgi:hypothetical protein